jgi:hypothetical protein
LLAQSTPSAPVATPPPPLSFFDAYLGPMAARALMAPDELAQPRRRQRRSGRADAVDGEPKPA